MHEFYVRCADLDFHKLDEFIFVKMSKTHLPGMSIAVLENSEVTHSRGFGVRDLESGLRATPRTLYGIGSVTKSFTALAIMQLTTEEKLGLEDPVSKHTPLVLGSPDEPVRVWHLLTHSSGIPALAYAEALIRYVTGSGGEWLPMASYDDLFTFLTDANKWTLTAPGERWLYLNEGYLILGYLIEKLSGMSYEEYVKKNILEPLGMTRTFFSRKDVETDLDVATPYIITRDEECKKSTYTYSLSSDGGLISNALDMTHYITMYLNRGRYETKTILAAESVSEMERPRVPIPLQALGGEGYGFGLSIVPDFYGCKLVGHGGSVLVSTAYMGYLPEKNIGITLLANGAGYQLSQIGQYGLALMLGEGPEELPFIKMEQSLEALTGRYETYKGTMKAQVVERNGLLFIEIRDKHRDMVIPLIPEDLEGDVKIFHALQAGGKLPIEFIVDGERTDLIYERYRLKRSGRL